MKKTILFVYYFPINPVFGGIQRVTDLIARALINKGYNVLYLSLIEKEEEMNTDFPCPFYFFPSDDDTSKENIIFYHRFLKDHHVDVVINQAGSFNASRLFLDVGTNRVKRISVVHSSPLLYYNSYATITLTTKDSSLKEKINLLNKIVTYFSNKRRLLRHLNRHYQYIGDNSDFICLLSNSFKKELQVINFNHFSKVIAIPNPNSFTLTEVSYNKENILLFVGRLDKSEKRPDRLLKIWNRLYKDFPDWEMIIVGDGEERTRLERKAKRYSLKRISFKGIQRPNEYYEKAAIFCLTSNFEGFPMVLTEAMQYGVVPVLFDSFLSARDVVLPGETGFLAKPFNIKDFVCKVRGLMKDEEIRRQMAQSAFNHVKQFDVEVIIEKWIKLIES